MCSHKYLFYFEPLDSFSFSGETSAQTKGYTDTFLAKTPNATRRQSFYVKTDCMPPQTTVMGAVRYMLFEKMSIGDKSFTLASEETQTFGAITGISPVFVYNKSEGEILLPSPKMSGDEPVDLDNYNAKRGLEDKFLVYQDGQYKEMRDLDEIFEVYEQPVFHVPESGVPEADDGSYHIQQKCKMRSGYSFGVIVTLNEEIKKEVRPKLLTLGGRDGRFMATYEDTELDLEKLVLFRKRYCISLLSPAILPADWRNASGLIQAFCQAKPMRCATSDDKFRLTLIAQKLMLAETGSVFIFDSEESRDEFYKALCGDARRVCGFNYALKYEL